LLEFPQGEAFAETWKAMEKVRVAVRSMGQHEILRKFLESS
jgi:hypothetical protein